MRVGEGGGVNRRSDKKLHSIEKKCSIYRDSSQSIHETKIILNSEILDGMDVQISSLIFKWSYRS